MMKGHRKNPLGMYTDRQVGTKSKGSRGGAPPHPMDAGIDEGDEGHDEYLAYMAQHGGDTEQPRRSDRYVDGIGVGGGGGGGGQGSDEYIEPAVHDEFY